MMELIRLEHTDYLYLLLLIPIFALVFIFLRLKRRKKLDKFGDIRLIDSLMPDISSYKPHLRYIILMAALLFFVIGIANPQIGSKVEEFKREGVDVVIAIDVSKSMMAEDIKPNRLSRAKQAVSRLIDELRNDRIGIIVFAGNAFLQLPLTSDYSAAKLLLSTIEPDIVSVQGTAIGNAIKLATDAFPEDDDKHKVLIIITDGENHEDDALGKAKESAEKGVVIHTIGMGSISGAPIPEGKSGFKKDRDGNIVVSKLDASMLQQVAVSGGGRFIRAGGPDPELSNLLEDISKMDKKEYESRLITDYEDRFQYFIAVAFILLLLEFFLSDRKNLILTKLSNFVEKS